MSIQRMPYPPYIKMDQADIILRQVICTFAVIAFLMPLCVETNYASQEKFIGITVSTVSYNLFMSYTIFLIAIKYYIFYCL